MGAGHNSSIDWWTLGKKAIFLEAFPYPSLMV